MGRPTARHLRRPRDDLVLPFRTVRSGVIGRLVRLGRRSIPVLSRATPIRAASSRAGRSGGADGAARHGAEVRRQADPADQDRRAVDFLVVDYEAPGRLRGYARFDKKQRRCETKVPRRAGPSCSATGISP